MNCLHGGTPFPSKDDLPEGWLWRQGSGRRFRFLGVEDLAETVPRRASGVAFERVSGGRARETENHASLFRKGAIRDWEVRFDDAAHDYVTEKAGPRMRRSGYL